MHLLGHLRTFAIVAVCVLPAGADPVEIVRDTYGVPHIRGSTLADVLFGQGYCHAEDNLPVVLSGILASRGESALHGGDGRRGSIEVDFSVRIFGLQTVARRNYESLSAADRRLVDAFAMGIAKFLSEHPEKRPSWLGDISGVDVIAITKLRQLQQSLGVARDDLSGKAASRRERELAMALDRNGASNIWALRPSRTSDGSTRLMSDPHLPWEGATKWHEAHLIVGDRWIYGASFAGCPGVAIGFTADLAWGFTNNGADIADVYRLKLNPANPNQYLYEGAWRNLRNETFAVEARGENGEVQRIERVVRFSHQGPIMQEDRKANEAFAVRLAAFESHSEVLDWVNTMGATSLAEFEAALDRAHGYKWNCVAADSSGNIGYYYLCAARERDESLAWNAPVDGSSAKTEWGPALSWRKLPHIVNPSGGYLVNCNNNAFTVTRGGDLKPGKYPRSYGSQSTKLATDSRAHRAIDLIEARAKHDQASVAAITFDLRTLTAEPLVKRILGAAGSMGAGGKGGSEKRAAALRILREWDGFATIGNQALPLLAGFLQAAENEGLSLRQLEKQSPKGLMTLFDAGLDLLEKRWGSGPVTWGQLHVIRRGDLEVPVPGAGSERGKDPFSTLFMVGAKTMENGQYLADSGSSWLQSVAYLKGKVTAGTVLPLGNSNDPNSKHFNDQARLYAAREMKPALLARVEIEANAESRLRLESPY
ncbi:MAG: penicillin acylase family protein [Opitutaceae bacterium]|nr:penicillin acylase family protein [Opitutaceae bacterium]